MWGDGQLTRATLDWLQAFIERRAASPDHAQLLTLGIEEGRWQATRFPAGLPPAEIPLAVYSAAGGGAPWPFPIAATGLCVYLGADVLDNVVDRELSARWADYGPDQAILVGVTIGSPLSMACLDELESTPARRMAAQHALIDAMLVMSAGELADVASEGQTDVSLDACEAMVVAKSGAEYELFARMGAVVAGASPATCDAYAIFGRELGVVAQLVGDCADLVEGGPGRDLVSGKRTLPLVHALLALPNAERAELRDHLAAAAQGADRTHAVRRLLLKAGSFHFGALSIEVHRQRALESLRSARPQGLAAEYLIDLTLGR